MDLFPNEGLLSAEGHPLGFLLLMLAIAAGGVLLVVGHVLWKQRRIRRLQNPRKDYYRR